MMKRVILLLLCAACLFLPVHAEKEPNVGWETPEHLPQVGEQYEICLKIYHNPGISTVQLTLCWNEDAAECIDAEKGAAIQNFIFVKNLTKEGKATIAAASAEGSTQNGEMVLFRFLATGSGSAFFTVSDIQASDQDGNPIPLEAVSFSLSEADKTENSAANGYSDVPTTHWAYSAVMAASSAGWVNGYENGCFLPERLVTRAEFAVILWRFSGSPEPDKPADFTDVDEGIWYAKAVAWAYENGYVKGTSETLFSPENTLTREQAVTVFFRVKGGVQGMENLYSEIYASQFVDRGQASEWAVPALDWAVFNGLVTGVTETQLQPKGLLNRAQMAALICRFAEQGGERTL